MSFGEPLSRNSSSYQRTERAGEMVFPNSLSCNGSLRRPRPACVPTRVAEPVGDVEGGRCLGPEKGSWKWVYSKESGKTGRAALGPSFEPGLRSSFFLQTRQFSFQTKWLLSVSRQPCSSFLSFRLTAPVFISDESTHPSFRRILLQFLFFRRNRQSAQFPGSLQLYLPPPRSPRPPLPLHPS